MNDLRILGPRDSGRGILVEYDRVYRPKRKKESIYDQRKS